MTRLFEDLRFVIGLFFALLGIILVGIGVRQGVSNGLRLDLLAGGAMLVFSIGMIALSFLDRQDKRERSDF